MTQTTLKTYLVKSTHDVYEDDYNEGEGAHVNWYTLDQTIKAESPEAAIAEYYKLKLGREYDKGNTMVDEGALFDSRLVDEDGMNASPFEIEMWKKGELKLYADNIRITVQEMVPVLLEDYNN